MWYVIQSKKIKYYIALLNRFGSQYLGYEKPLDAFRPFELRLKVMKDKDGLKYALLLQDLIVARIEYKNGKHTIIESIPYSDFLHDT